MSTPHAAADTASPATPPRDHAPDSPRIAWGVALVLALLFACAATFCGCAGVPQEQHDALQAKYAALEAAAAAKDAKHDEMSARNARLDALLTAALDRIDQLMGELSKFITGRRGD